MDANQESADRTCDRHPGTELLADTFGHWYCPDCDDEAHAALIDKGVPSAGGRLPEIPQSPLQAWPGPPPYVVPERVARETGSGTDFLARLNAGAPIPSNGQPKTPDFAEAVNQRAQAAAEHNEAALRASLRSTIRNEIGLHLEGHRGVVKQLRAAVYDTAADAAVDAFIEAVRGGITQAHVVAHPGQPRIRPGVIIVDGVRYVPEVAPRTHADAFDDLNLGPGWSSMNEPSSGITQRVIDKVNARLAEHGLDPNGDAR